MTQYRGTYDKWPPLPPNGISWRNRFAILKMSISWWTYQLLRASPFMKPLLTLLVLLMRLTESFFFFIDKKAVIRNQVKINQNQYRPSLEMLFGDFKTEPSTEPIDCSYQVHWTHWLHRSTGIASFSYAIEMNRFNFNVISKPDPMTLKWLKFFQYWNRFRNPIQSYTSECN